ncbi:adenylate/guanylate cyclase domain-containing protein [Candidatus Venteria ishoeyi]|uniref:Adenylate cyclase 2 n=1 Tax=Candidatus Venteria ishoeyi TaxID=1899563 RepID=A0A1H6FAF3_9GAMM|nr:adenylate/guanylate cyclase domain-containing protein [Candidatus Venteria ishoeyi]SEH07090.1 Adenylate cyclase 2 [Candidatus Venteria ishoeyi]
MDTEHGIALTSHRITVLLIDDQQIIGEAVQRMVHEEPDIDFHYCQDPTRAIGLANKIQPTVILQDLVMPEVQGLTLVRYFRANPATRDVPLIVLSSKEEGDVKAKAFSVGANDYMVKLPDPLEVIARIRHHSRGYINLLERNEAMKELEKANGFIRQTFGRYLSEDVVDTLLESPDGLELGGEKRVATIMMTDLRGFTAISERLPPETVVAMINIYLERMTDIIFKYQGTIDEFIGDAILAIFGAPVQRDNDAQRAVACALEMQQAMTEVNQMNCDANYPEVDMGIGINTGALVVGNIGSSKRAKYGVVGQHVNLTSRIESYSIGGQILVSEHTLKACGDILRIDEQMEVMPKGVKKPMTISEIGGIGGDFNIYLPEKISQPLSILATPLAIQFTVLAEKDVGQVLWPGKILRLLENSADVETQTPIDKLSNLKISLLNAQEAVLYQELYAKVTAILPATAPVAESATKQQDDTQQYLFRIVFTSLPPEAQAFLKTLNLKV